MARCLERMLAFGMRVWTIFDQACRTEAVSKDSERDDHIVKMNFVEGLIKNGCAE